MSPKKKSPPKNSKANHEPQGYRPFTALKDLEIPVEKSGKTPPVVSYPTAAARALPTSVERARTDEEAIALHRMMSGVVPLNSRARRIPRGESALPTGNLDDRRAEADARALREVESVHAHLRALIEGGRFEVEDDGRKVEGRRAGIAPDVVRKLRRGLFPIDARLDLHGLRAEEARTAVETFLSEKRARGDRCVLIVHGKGEHSPGGFGILRGEMSAWLSQGMSSAHVAAFSTASPEDGGEGAVYVLLAR